MKKDNIIFWENIAHQGISTFLKVNNTCSSVVWLELELLNEPWNAYEIARMVWLGSISLLLFLCSIVCLGAFSPPLGAFFALSQFWSIPPPPAHSPGAFYIFLHSCISSSFRDLPLLKLPPLGVLSSFFFVFFLHIPLFLPLSLLSKALSYGNSCLSLPYLLAMHSFGLGMHRLNLHLELTHGYDPT